MSDTMAAKEFTNHEIARALLLCRDDTGKSCRICPYEKYPGACSKKLLSDAADVIFAIPEENRNESQLERTDLQE